MNKEQQLEEYLISLKSVAVAFSSGVDSTYLLKKAHDVLGNQALAITVTSSLFPARELDESIAFCKKENIKQIIIHMNELDIPGFATNPKNRCYICKYHLFTKIIEIAQENGINEVVEGSNMDDLGDYRPGLQAIQELGIKSPLREVHLYKQEIRDLSQKLNLPTWDKPSFACLASRFVYGETISLEKLEMVEHAEQFLLNMGFKQLRVRIHDKMARIEVEPNDIIKIVENKDIIDQQLKSYGFSYVAVDLHGYTMGSMNKEIL
ncbi:MAG: ATP-dependent sacrificial sulfur transferase LarE [Erysipelotrichaceae bacterium]|nr:ATP-dependent sacrificial sulfur transferase LarE [Erysipelotrichaceae bacterium]